MFAMSHTPYSLIELLPGKGQRVDDFRPEFPEHTDDQIREALEMLVTVGSAKKYEREGQTFYLKKI